MKKILLAVVFIALLGGFGTAFADNTQLVQDVTGATIQGAMTPIVAQSVSVTGTSAINPTDFTNWIVRVTCTTNVFYKLGTSASTALTTDHFLASGSTEYFNVKGFSRIAFLQVSASGTCYISEMR